jgi:hypothetical protein
MHRHREHTLHVRTSLAVALAALLLSAGCSQPPLPPASKSASAPVHASVSAGALALSVELPVASFPASSTQTAIVTVSNASETATQIVTPVVWFRIVGSSGKPVVDWPTPHPMPFPGLTRIAAHGQWTGRLRFQVPPPGYYTLEVRDVANTPFPGSASLRFASAR